MRHIVPHRLEMRVGEQRRDVVLAAGEIIVDAQDVVAVGAQPLAQVRAEKPGAAGDENPFHDSAHVTS